MHIPNNLLFTKEHEWIKIDDSTGVMGVTDHAQISLGDITFIELPKVGDDISQFQPLATIESVKAASDIYSPLSGTIIEVNKALETDPGLINKACYEDGWIAKIRLKDRSETENLLNPAAYKTLLGEYDH